MSLGTGTTRFMYQQVPPLVNHDIPYRDANRQSASFSIHPNSFQVEHLSQSQQRHKCLPACHRIILFQAHLARTEEERWAGVSLPCQQVLLETARAQRASCPSATPRKAWNILSGMARAATSEGLIAISGSCYLSALSTVAFRVGQEPTPNPRDKLWLYLEVSLK